MPQPTGDPDRDQDRDPPTGNKVIERFNPPRVPSNSRVAPTESLQKYRGVGSMTPGKCAEGSYPTGGNKRGW